VAISVLDDGIGMPSTRNGSSPGKTAGAGLGLSIAKGIVQAHGGRFELTTGSDTRGTCFTVYLPVEAEVLDPVPTKESL